MEKQKIQYNHNETKKRMKVAMMQPAFMPWQGFFELIYNSEVFIFLDDFQFSVQSFHQRNKLFISKNKVGWYSVPIQKSISFLSQLNNTKINESTLWREKMWKRLLANYSKAPFFNELLPIIQGWLFKKYNSLAELNIEFIILVCKLMGIDRNFLFSSNLHIESRSSFRVLELLKLVSADCYYCAHGSFGYMLKERVFPVQNINVLFQNYQPQPYAQVRNSEEFIPYLSILDALFNIGPNETLKLIKKGTLKWLNWEERKNYDI